MEHVTDDKHTTFVIPARTLSGSVDEMLAQIDEAVTALLAYRHLLAVQAARPTDPHLPVPRP